MLRFEILCKSVSIFLAIVGCCSVASLGQDSSRDLPALTRFLLSNFARNLELVDRVKDIASEKGCTAGQLALAWVHAQGDDVVPIPGTKRRTYLEENVAALDVTLEPADLARIEEAFPMRDVAGDRYPDMRFVAGTTPEATSRATGR